MILLLEIILVFCVLCLLHTYLIYPISLKLLTENKKNNSICFDLNDINLPHVCVIMSAFNEESVIHSKLVSLENTHYPKNKIHIFVGSDASTDSTNDIISDFILNKQNFRFLQFPERRGKPSVVNDLANFALNKITSEFDISQNLPVFILTDASVILTPLTIFNLVKHFKNPEIALVDSNQIARTMNSKEGIAEAEKTYIGAEVILKHNEGLLNNNMLGPLGGCYALRSDFFIPIPTNRLVDDFYLAMRVLERNGGAINDLDAVCYEPLPSSIGVEYRRKRRISTGNFQNLQTFSRFLVQFNIRSYIFWSHKVLRWLGPFFLIGILLSTILLNLKSPSNQFLFLLIIELFFLMLLPLFDYFLTKMGLHSKYLRAWRYLILMNLALFEGFIIFLGGVKSGIWQPTPRN